ncbi:LysR family transcriptional regulator [Streptacidiphilus jiangxiensis]|uniref:DNA-binding transcriptional regulator, LysR family n=1 Tax=Streptacidiphilus jiangxiensis TaxID=235985 RepID=A0A1H7ZRJ8_STRJI|nr:LysR family transcriptional regulator [Streptacidiphilus jiangxiensis]SEM60913.1 DNA-binding transcriptional regulator, LysR family [Streptacidiphilus jiangxiensis]
MDARQLSYFLAVVEHGGFTRAADALHLAQPSLSQAIRALERELGARLFQRAGRGVVLTSAGEALVTPARRVGLELVAAREAVASVVGLVAGRVDLVVQAAAADAAGELTARFRQRHPAVTVRLTEPRRPPFLTRDLREGDAQLGLSYLPVTETQGLVVDPLREVEMVAVLPPGSVAPQTMRVEDLADLPLVVGAPGTAWRMLTDGLFAEADVAPRIAVESVYREAVGPLITEGGLAAVMHAGLAPEGSVVRALHPRVRRTLALLRRPGVLPPAAEAFLQLARLPPAQGSEAVARAAPPRGRAQPPSK